jgi:hypothetical protein
MFNEIILLTITVFPFNIMHTYKKNAALYNKWNRKIDDNITNIVQKKKTGMITKWHKTSCCNITDQINYDMSSYVNNIHNVNWVSVRISVR